MDYSSCVERWRTWWLDCCHLRLFFSLYVGGKDEETLKSVAASRLPPGCCLESPALPTFLCSLLRSLPPSLVSAVNEPERFNLHGESVHVHNLPWTCFWAPTIHHNVKKSGIPLVNTTDCAIIFKRWFHGHLEFPNTSGELQIWKREWRWRVAVVAVDSPVTML